jgi:putative NIF3 family GTP cyclohydrolase 1 type 2
MTSQQIYDLAIKMGCAADPRGEKKIKEMMRRRKERYEKMSEEEKKYYNKEKFNNPYPDSIVFIGAPDKKIKKVLAGIDIDTAEVLLADKLGKIDLIISHHPIWLNVPEVLDMQVDYLNQCGIPVNIIEWLTQERFMEIERATKPINHLRTIDNIKLLGMSMISPHTPMDILAYDFINKIIKKKKVRYVSDIMEILMEIPEYQIAAKEGFGPSLFSGQKDNRTGKIVFGFFGGTSPSYKIYEKMSQAGIGSIIDMHIGEESRKEAEKYHINIVIAGHYSSDSLGTNLFLDEIEKKGIEIIPCSGLIRVKRYKK